jgi:hypothetical protein
MSQRITLLMVLFAAFAMIGCNKYIKSGIGGSTDVMLNRNSDEYTIKRLKTIEMDGKALFGIPGVGSNNKNQNKGGLIFKFNGIEIGKTPRFLPILTALGLGYGFTTLTQSVIKRNEANMYEYDQWGFPILKKSLLFNSRGANVGQLRTPFAMLIGVPVAGMVNNLLWEGSAASGLTNQMYYKLVDENPEVDIFTNPKYKIDYKHGLFNQKATIRADVMGATIKLK